MMSPMYNDIGDSLHIVNKNRPQEKCEIKFHRAGWFGKEWHILEGRSYMESSDGKS